MTAHSLDRLIFKTSRLAEFCSRKELTNQTGHGVEDWPLVVLKELVDNAIDACEEAGIAAIVEIVVSDGAVAVTDNGHGIAPGTVADILDYSSRVSSREAYASPTRGAQGNALKTLLAIPFALDGECGETVIESHGAAHRITFATDPIRQEPRVNRVCEASLRKIGTRVAVSWPNSACLILDAALDRSLQMAEDYTWANPHLTLTVVWDLSRDDPIRWTIAATDSAWRKWSPSDPTSPHWYDEARLGRLMAAYISHDRRPWPAVPHSAGFRERISRP